MPVKKLSSKYATSKQLNKLSFEMHDRFVNMQNQMDERFTQIDQRFTQIDQRFTQIDQRFAQMDERFTKIDERFIEMGQRFKDTHHLIKGLFQDLDRKFTEALLPTQMTAEHNVQLKDHEGRIEKLERNVHVIKLAIKQPHKT